MKIRHDMVATGEIEHEVIAGANKTARRLVWRACNDRVRGRTWILHRHGCHTLTRIMHNNMANTRTDAGWSSFRTVGDGQRIGGRVELVAKAWRVVIDVHEIDPVGLCQRSIGRAETGNHATEALGLVELHSRSAFEDNGMTG